ncbi:hypothetical protein OIU78_008597 [Salix suchowensis]|nr:hypothetical protein OIU78_008597 [Salix suchowensis]
MFLGELLSSVLSLFYCSLKTVVQRETTPRRWKVAPDLQQLSKNNHLLVKHNIDDDHQKHAHAHLSSHMDHTDPSDKIFFTIEDLKVGKKIPIYFSHRDPSNSPHLISREEADSIPFSLAKLPYLLDFFSLSGESPQAKAMEYTLTLCEVEPMEGETKVCATSLESMLDFARATFGLDTRVRALTTNHVRNQVSPFTKLHPFGRAQGDLGAKNDRVPYLALPLCSLLLP